MWHDFALLIIINQIAYKQAGQLWKCHKIADIFFTILHTPWQLCFFDMVGWKFTLCQYCKKFSSWKKSFLWSRWSPAEGQLIFPFRFYGSKIWQFFLAANLLQKHFSLSFCSRWGISIEIIWHADKWFPWTRRRFSWAEASLKGIARSGLDWLTDHSTFPVSFPSRKGPLL